jgi:hypothetical protein
LGHPDKKLRWRAIHSLRRLANLNDIGILKVLLEKQNEKDCFPFQNKEYMYYWMSAKLYLWIAIDRISVENPNAIISFKDVFYADSMTDSNIPGVAYATVYPIAMVFLILFIQLIALVIV